MIDWQRIADEVVHAHNVEKRLRALKDHWEEQTGRTDGAFQTERGTTQDARKAAEMLIND